MSSGKRKQKATAHSTARKTGVFRKFMYLLIGAAAILALVIIFTLPKNAGEVTSPGKNAASANAANDFHKDGELVFASDAGVEITRIEIELADTPAKTTLGLMFRDKLGPDQGMLFIFPDLEPRAFWMKNTILPLDMIFADDSGIIVTIHPRTAPYSEESYISTIPAKYVVEVNAGFVDRYEIKPGDKISFTIDNQFVR